MNLTDFINGVNSISSDVANLATAHSDNQTVKVRLVQVLEDNGVSHFLYAVGEKAVNSVQQMEGFSKTKLDGLVKNIKSKDLKKTAKEIGLNQIATVLASFGKLGKQSVHMTIQDEATADNAFGFLEIEHLFKNAQSLASQGRCNLKGLDTSKLAKAEGDEDAQLQLIVPVVMSSLSSAKVSHGVVRTFENKALATANRINRKRSASVMDNNASSSNDSVGIDLSDI